MSFHCLMAHFFMVLNNIALCEWTSLFTCWRTFWFLTNFGYYNKVLYISVYRFLRGHKYSASLSRYQGA